MRMANDEPEMLRVRLDEGSLRQDLKQGMQLSGINNSSDLVRHAVRMLVAKLQREVTK